MGERNPCPKPDKQTDLVPSLLGILIRVTAFIERDIVVHQLFQEGTGLEAKAEDLVAESQAVIKKWQKFYP